MRPKPPSRSRSQGTHCQGAPSTGPGSPRGRVSWVPPILWLWALGRVGPGEIGRLTSGDMLRLAMTLCTKGQLVLAPGKMCIPQVMARGLPLSSTTLAVSGNAPWQWGPGEPTLGCPGPTLLGLPDSPSPGDYIGGQGPSSSFYRAGNSTGGPSAGTSPQHSLPEAIATLKSPLFGTRLRLLPAHSPL